MKTKLESAKEILLQLCRDDELHNPYVGESHIKAWREIWIYEHLKQHGFQHKLGVWSRTEEDAKRSYALRSRPHLPTINIPHNAVVAVFENSKLAYWRCLGCDRRYGV